MLLSKAVFEETRQLPSKLVLILRGIAKGEPTVRLARELGIRRVRLHQECIKSTSPTMSPPTRRWPTPIKSIRKSSGGCVALDDFRTQRKLEPFYERGLGTHL